MGSSFEPLVWALSLGREAGLNCTTKAVLVAMANRCGDADGGECFPSYDTIAADALVTDRTAQEAVKQLVALGLVTRTDRGNGRGKVSRYVLNVQKVENECIVKVENGDKPENGKVEAVSLKVEADNGKVEAPSLKVEAASSEPPINHPEPPINHPIAARSKGTRLSENWQPNAALRAYARDHGLDPDKTLVEFREWYLSAPGAKGVWLRWDLVWQRWCRNQNTRTQQPRFNGHPIERQRPSQMAHIARMILDRGGPPDPEPPLFDFDATAEPMP